MRYCAAGVNAYSGDSLGRVLIFGKSSFVS